MIKPLHFKSKKTYLKWQSYRHIHGIKTKHPYRKIYIKGKQHKVKHKRWKNEQNKCNINAQK